MSEEMSFQIDIDKIKVFVVQTLVLNIALNRRLENRVIYKEVQPYEKKDDIKRVYDSL